MSQSSKYKASIEAILKNIFTPVAILEDIIDGALFFITKDLNSSKNFSNNPVIPIIHFIPFSTKNKQFFFVAFTVEKSTAISGLLFFMKDSKLLKCSLFIPLLSVALTKFA